MDIIKRIVLYLLIFPLVARGFAGNRAKKWVRKVYADLIWNKKYSFREKIWAYRRGYLPEQVRNFGVTPQNVEDFVSEKDYFYIQPINGIYRKWLAGKVSARKIFSPFSKNLQKLYFLITYEDGAFSVLNLDDNVQEKSDINSVIRFLKERHTLVITSPNPGRSVLLEWRDGKFYFDHEEIEAEKKVLRRIRDFDEAVIIAEYIKPAAGFENNFSDFGNQLRLIILNNNITAPHISEAFLRIDAHYTENVEELNKELLAAYGKICVDLDDEDDDEQNADDNEYYFKGIIADIDKKTGAYGSGKIVLDGDIEDAPYELRTKEPISGEIPHWNELMTEVKKLCKYAPQLKFFAVDILITEDSFKFMQFVNVPAYPSIRMYGKETISFLEKRIAEKNSTAGTLRNICKRGGKQIRLKIRRGFAALFFPKGLLPYLSTRWIKDVTVDLFTNRSVSLRRKIWAYRHGFISYRLDQYGINEDNVNDFISDFEYKWLRHINGKYRAWFEDKITFKYILSDHSECFPEYYYHIELEDGVNKIIDMMDCPEGYEASYEDILRLARDKGVLALKPDEGSHGDGFYKLSYVNGKYCLNFDTASEEDILGVLQNTDNSYLITEYIENHPQFREIYDGAVNTIRVIVFKEDGLHAQIGNTYMRFGSKATGAVDNMGAGGMFAEVDTETGRYENAKIILKNTIQDCPYHPDSGVKIEGYIPHWEYVKAKIIEMAESVPQLEYFGFDVAITENGVKLPEINRFPDYPKIEKLSPETMRYLLMKLEQKKKKYGYDKKPCRKLIHLPRR